MTTKSLTDRHLQTHRLRALDSVASARIIICSVADGGPPAALQLKSARLFGAK